MEPDWKKMATELSGRVMKAMMLSEVSGVPLPSVKDAGEFFGVTVVALKRLGMFDKLAEDGGVESDQLLSLFATMIAGLLMRATKDQAAVENTLPNGMTLEELLKYRPKPGDTNLN